MRQAFVGGMMLLLAGCGAAQVAMAPPGQDIAGKQFNPPPAGMAAVYFYNPISTGPVINVGAGPMIVGQLAPMTWMRAELSPGRHAMRCVTTYSSNPSSITLSPGDIRFVDVEMPPGSPVCTIQETGPDAGRAGVLSGSRAMQPQ
jgi:hypothetical protein